MSVGRHTAALLLTNAGSSALGFLRQFLVARVLDPQQFGVWNLLTVLLSYMNYADVGLNNGLLFKAAPLHGAGRVEEAQRIRGQAIAGTWVLMGGLAVVLFGISWLPILENKANIVRLLAMAGLVFTLVNVYHVEGRLCGRFPLIGVATLLSALSALLLTVWVSRATEQYLIEVLALAWLLGSVVAIALLVAKLRIRWAWPLDWRILRQLVRLGVPLTLLSVVFVLFQSLDRWVLALLIAAEELGYVALGTTIGMFLYLLPSSVGVVITTRLLHGLGASQDPRTSRNAVLPSLWVSAYGMALVAGGVIAILPFVLVHILPAYEDGWAVIVIVIVANCMLFPTAVVTNLLMAAQKGGRLLRALAIVILMKAILIGALGYFDVVWGGVALLASNLIYASIVTAMALSSLGFSWQHVISMLGGIFLPLTVCSIVAAASRHVGALTGNLWSDLVVSFWRGMVFLFIGAMVCILFARKREGRRILHGVLRRDGK